MVRTADRLVKVSKRALKPRSLKAADVRGPCFKIASAKDAVVRAAERFVEAEPLLALDHGHGLIGAVKRLHAARKGTR